MRCVGETLSPTHLSSCAFQLADTPTHALLGIKGSKGPASSLFIDEVTTPVPGKDEVLVKVKAFGLNRMDISQREGRYPVPPQAGPILGVEFSGTVAELGDITGTASWKVGDEVFGLVYGGSCSFSCSCLGELLSTHALNFVGYNRSLR